MSAAETAARQVLTVRSGEERIGLPAAEVMEVIRRPPLTRVPHAPPSLAGVANLRGAVLPVVSLAGLLGRETAAASSSTRVVVMDCGVAVGLLVDEVHFLAAVPGGTQDGAPPSSPGGKRTRATVKARTDTVRLIELRDLLDREFSALGKSAVTKVSSSGANPAHAGHQVERDEVALVVFEVAGQDFALPLAAVREVTTVPTEVTVAPHSDNAVLGVAPLRGVLLPLVSTRVLLGFPDVAPSATGGRIVVTRIGDALVGLLVDGMKAIHRAPLSAIDAVPAVLSRADGEAEIDSICRVDGGRRLVSILSTERLFRSQRMAHILSAATGEADPMTTDLQPAAIQQFLIFRLGEEHYGLPIAAVEEVVRTPETLTRVPRAPAFIEGVMNLRGKVVPIIDQRRRFDSESAAARGRVVVIRLDDTRAGFVVDGVSEVLSATGDQISAAPDLGGDRAQVFDRVLHIRETGRMILLIDPRELLDRAEKDLLAEMARVNATTGAA